MTGTAFLMGSCWCFMRPYAALVLFAIATSGALLCPTGILLALLLALYY